MPPGARRETLPATDAAGGAGGHVDALDGARRRLVVLELVIDLEPIALGVRGCPKSFAMSVFNRLGVSFWID